MEPDSEGAAAAIATARCRVCVAAPHSPQLVAPRRASRLGQRRLSPTSESRALDSERAYGRAERRHAAAGRRCPILAAWTSPPGVGAALGRSPTESRLACSPACPHISHILPSLRGPLSPLFYRSGLDHSNTYRAQARLARADATLLRAAASSMPRSPYAAALLRADAAGDARARAAALGAVVRLRRAAKVHHPFAWAGACSSCLGDGASCGDGHARHRGRAREGHASLHLRRRGVRTPLPGAVHVCALPTFGRRRRPAAPAPLPPLPLALWPGCAAASLPVSTALTPGELRWSGGFISAAGGEARATRPSQYAVRCTCAPDALLPRTRTPTIGTDAVKRRRVPAHANAPARLGRRVEVLLACSPAVWQAPARWLAIC